MATRNNNKYFAVPLLYALICVALAIAIDASVGGAIENVKIIRLEAEAVEGAASIGHKIAALRDSVAEVRAQLDSKLARKYPSLQEIRELARQHRLSVNDVERVGGRGNVGELDDFRIVFHGNIKRIVAFLKQLENDFICDCSNLTLQPVDGSGIVIALKMQMSTVSQ